MSTLSIHDINNIDIVDFLAKRGYQPRKIQGNNFWYNSPLPDRNDDTPSFKVNRKLNRWYDFGTGEGSTLLDLAMRLYDWTIRDAILNLSDNSFTIPHVPQKSAQLHQPSLSQIKILRTHPITSFYLIRYLWERRIPLNVAQKYCVEAEYSFGERSYYAIAFPNPAGGYELRNKFHKYSVSPKSPTLISNHSSEIAIFEGFFNMLTFVSITSLPDHQLPDLGVLNGSALSETFAPQLTNYRRKHLFLANDATGDKITAMAYQLGVNYFDHRSLYKGYNDLNEWACRVGTARIHDLNKEGEGPPENP